MYLDMRQLSQGSVRRPFRGFGWLTPGYLRAAKLAQNRRIACLLHVHVEK